MLEQSNNESVLDYLKSCEVKTINLEDGQPFAIIIKSDDMDSSFLENIKKNLQSAYPNCEKIAIWGIGTDEEIDYVTIKEVLEKANGIS